MTKAKHICLKWAITSSSKPLASGFWKVVGWPIGYPTPAKVLWLAKNQKFTKM
jgi:hypothetical protein